MGTREKKNLFRMQATEQIMTVKEVARILQLHPDSVRRRCREGRMPSFRLFGQIRFRRGDVNEWLRGLRESARESVPESGERFNVAG